MPLERQDLGGCRRDGQNLFCWETACHEPVAFRVADGEPAFAVAEQTRLSPQAWVAAAAREEAGARRALEFQLGSPERPARPKAVVAARQRLPPALALERSLVVGGFLPAL
jgi:hypothetical protein